MNKQSTGSGNRQWAVKEAKFSQSEVVTSTSGPKRTFLRNLLPVFLYNPLGTFELPVGCPEPDLNMSLQADTSSSSK